MTGYSELTQVTEKKIRSNLERAAAATSLDAYMQWKSFADGVHSLWMLLAPMCCDVDAQTFGEDADRLTGLFDVGFGGSKPAETVLEI